MLHEKCHMSHQTSFSFISPLKVYTSFSIISPKVSNLLKGIDNCSGAAQSVAQGTWEFLGQQDLLTSDFDPLGISKIY